MSIRIYSRFLWEFNGLCPKRHATKTFLLSGYTQLEIVADQSTLELLHVLSMITNLILSSDTLKTKHAHPHGEAVLKSTTIYVFEQE